MLKSLITDNFRTHKHSELNFVQGVNVLLGLPGSGKTNILRNLKWIISNRPSGTKMISKFMSKKDACESILYFDDYRVEVVKSQTGSTSYTLFKSSEKVDEFLKVNKDVPDIIAQALNISETNIHSQLDSPYLITQTPGEVARVLNKIVKIEQTDGWISSLTTEVNSLNKTVESSKSSLKKEQEKLGQYKNLDEMEKDVIGLEKLEQDLETTNEDISAVGFLLSNIDKIQVKINNLIDVKLLEKELAKVSNDFNQFKDLSVDIDDLDNLLRGIGNVNKRLEAIPDISDMGMLLSSVQASFMGVEETGRRIDLLEQFIQAENELSGLEEDIADFEPVVTALENKFRDYQKVNSGVISLENVLIGISTKERDKNAATGKFEQMKGNFESYLESVGRCPICYSEIDEKKIKEMVG